MTTENAETTEPPKQRGFEYRGTFYPLPGINDLRQNDPVLFAETTGIRWIDFLTALLSGEEDESLEGIDETLVLNGLMAVAIWQAHPRWTRAKALLFFQNMKSSEVELVGVDDDEDEQNEEEVPLPSSGDGPEPSSSSPKQSSDEPDSPSETSKHTTSGPPESDTG